jgi:hypothetical protein
MPWAGSIIVAYSSENRCKTMQGLVSGDGDIRGRMNAAPDTIQPFPETIMKSMATKAKEMRSRNLTPEQVEAEILTNKAEADSLES